MAMIPRQSGPHSRQTAVVPSFVGVTGYELQGICEEYLYHSCNDTTIDHHEWYSRYWRWEDHFNARDARNTERREKEKGGVRATRV